MKTRILKNANGVMINDAFYTRSGVDGIYYYDTIYSEKELDKLKEALPYLREYLIKKEMMSEKGVIVFDPCWVGHELLELYAEPEEWAQYPVLALEDFSDFNFEIADGGWAIRLKENVYAVGWHNRFR